MPQDAPAEDADLAPADPFPDSYEPRLEPTIVIDTMPDPAMESPPPTQDRWAEALTQGRLWFGQLTGLATEHEVMVNHNTYITNRLQQCEGALQQCQNEAAQKQAALQGQIATLQHEAISLTQNLQGAHEYIREADTDMQIMGARCIETANACKYWHDCQRISEITLGEADRTIRALQQRTPAPPTPLRPV